jgi:DNA-binding FadR family transcriptional regulator
LVEQIALQMEALIEQGVWPIGTRIPAEPELVEQLGASRNTVREAVKSLNHAGLLTARQGDGTYVSSTSALESLLIRRFRKSSVLETLEVRTALEQEAARLAAVRRTARDIDAMREILARVDAADFCDHYEDSIQTDLELHKAIIEASHNSVLIDLYHHMTTSLYESIYRLADYAGLVQFHKKTYHTLVEAIIEGNPEDAASAVQAYSAASWRTLTQEQEK